MRQGEWAWRTVQGMLTKTKQASAYWTVGSPPSPLNSRSSRLSPTPAQVFLPAPPTHAWGMKESKDLFVLLSPFSPYYARLEDAGPFLSYPEFFVGN